jgi:phosphate-selective porin OprO/OprP
MKSKYWVALLGTTMVLNGTALRAEDPTEIDAQATIRQLKDQLEDLDQKVKVLERKDELAEEAAAAKKKENPIVTISDKGFQFQSADKKFQIRLKGLLQVDSRNFIDDNSIGNGNDTLLLRRARPIIEGKVFDNWEFNFTPEFGGGGNGTIAGTSSAVGILDAFINAHYWDEFQIKAGKFKAPIGLEQLQSDAYRLFAENSLATNLVPNRDIGVQIHGSLWDNLLAYQVGVFNGSVDATYSANVGNADFEDSREAAARLFAHPFKQTNINELKGLGIGVSASYGSVNGTIANGAATPTYRTDGQQSFFAYRGTTIADGDRWRISPQGYYYYGPFGLLGEWVISSQEFRNTALAGAAGQRTKRIQNEAWQVSASYVLTGEDASFNGVTPKRPLSFSDGTWGAVELVGRYGYLSIDDAAFQPAGTGTFAAQQANSLADPAVSAKRAAAWGVGINWYLNKNVRVITDFFQTDFARGGQGIGAVTADNESVVITRLQLNY